MSAGKDPRKVLQGMRSRAQGNQFEQQLEAACTRYAETGAAQISKTPEPMKPLSPPNAYGQFKACYTKKAEPDFKGVLAGGRAIMFEAKSTATGEMEQSRITKEQAEKLDAYTAMGAHCFVLATFDEARAYRVPWMVWREMKKYFGRKHVTEEQLRPYAVPFGPGFTHDLLRSIPRPDDIKPGATLEDILVAYCGLPYGGEIDGHEWGVAYDRLIDLVYAICNLTEANADGIVKRLDQIDSQDGEV